MIKERTAAAKLKKQKMQEDAKTGKDIDENLQSMFGSFFNRFHGMQVHTILVFPCLA